MKVVPEYQKWIGDATDNWNNDDNWARSTQDELKKAENSYTDDVEASGYAPMYFTNITIREENPQVELYPEEYLDSQGSAHEILDLSERESATENIEYDMMVEPNDEEDGYRCIPYYMNRVNQIHFEPNAEMLHAELLTYEKAWVDYQLESGQWYTLASPLQGVVAGDFYTDKNGKEESEYFEDIEFNEDENSRVEPSVYQRGWDKEAKMITVGKTEGTSLAIQGNWSAVYNNVEEKYEPGQGFSLKVLDVPEGTESAIFRLPKADENYTYYNSDGTEATETSVTITRSENAGKLKSDELKGESPKEISVALIQNGDNDYYLIGNPFMARLDATAFFNVNSNLEKKYWLVTEDNQTVAVAVGSDNGWVTNENGSIASIAPLQSFFVQKTSTGSDEVKFTADMQTLETETSESSNALILTAQTEDGKTSRAAITYDMSADKGYAADEDAELFLDSNLSDVPAIYTVAGTMATSINRTSELYNIPVGIYGNSTERVTLSFEGLQHFSSATLYDAEERTETPIREGMTLTVQANTSGRYFLRAGTPTGNEVLNASDIQIYTLSGNRVMVASATPLKDIRVYNLSGALMKHVQAGVCSFELYLPDGIYIVKAENANGEVETAKVAVR